MLLNGLVRKVLLLLLISSSLLAINASAHHVLGRPAYSLNEDSNTPPSMQVETQIGDFSINYMVFPAFPKAGERGRINLYASNLDTGESFTGTVRFKVRDDSWFASEEEVLGSQQPDDFVFRQGFVFSQDGDYIITAEFESGGEPYVIDFPLRVGELTAIGPLGIAVAVILLSLVGVSVLQRRKKLGSRVRKAKQEETL
jgi:hypothetical protein